MTRGTLDMTKELSALQRARLSYNPKLPKVLRSGIKGLEVELGAPTQSVEMQEIFRKYFQIHTASLWLHLTQEMQILAKRP